MQLIELTNKNGMKLSVSSLGAVLVKALVPDQNDVLTDVVLGYETAAEYQQNTDTYFGATVGRNANRIAGAAFVIDGKTYQMNRNEGDNNLHSGPRGLQIREWAFERSETENAVTFLMQSPDGDQGFPGNLELKVSYLLTEDNAIHITYEGISDQATVFNPTNHSYFNLTGHHHGTILDHELTLYASQFTPVADSHSIPTGELLPVAGTPMDFLQAKPIGRDIDTDYEQLNYTGGYDHNFVLDKAPDTMGKAAQVFCPESGIGMEVYTDLPGIQLYAGNFLNNVKGKDGAVYQKRSGFCLETQYFPNAVNVSTFASPVIPAGVARKSCTIYKFL